MSDARELKNRKNPSTSTNRSATVRPEKAPITPAVKSFVTHYSTWFLLAGCYLAFGAVFPVLLTTESFWNMFVQGTTVVLLSIGMTFVMLTGEIDLSVASVAALSALFGLYCIMELKLPGYIALLLILLLGAVIGAINGLLVTKVRIPSLVATVTTWWMISGIVLFWTQGRSMTGYDDYWTYIGMGTIGPIRVVIIFLVITVAIAVIIAKRTVTGLRIYLVGGNPEAAKNMGIPVEKIKTTAFMLSGIFAALAGYTLSSRLGFVSPVFATEWLMPAIAAPVISGVSLRGGRGDLINVVAGAYLVQLIVLIVRIGGLGGWFYQLAQGLLIFIAVIVDTIRRRIMKLE
jgi:simple sugar transport system permease protein/ribose transport system permease protein